MNALFPYALELLGVAVFAVSGALTAARGRMDPLGFALLAVVAGVGGGTLRDVLVRQVPTVLRSGLYAIPALLGATALVVVTLLGVYGPATAVGAAVLCFAVRMIGVRYSLNAPMPPAAPEPRNDDG